MDQKRLKTLVKLHLCVVFLFLIFSLPLNGGKKEHFVTLKIQVNIEENIKFNEARKETLFVYICIGLTPPISSITKLLTAKKYDESHSSDRLD